MTKKYYTNTSEKIYTFDVLETHETRIGTVWWGKCQENNRYAWLDENGIQFVGEDRFEAIKLEEAHIPVGCQVWGGEIRDALPHGARYYMRKEVN